MLLAILATLLSSSPTVAEAATAPVLKLQRTNYKPDKRLDYDLSFNPATCEINRNEPFDVYYRDNNSGQRLDEFSGNSQKYFGPRVDSSFIGAKQASLRFEAFDEIQTKLKMRAEIMARIELVNGKCVVTTEITYGKKRYQLERINIEMKKIFGMPSGVEWVQLKGRDARGPVTDCVVGECE